MKFIIEKKGEKFLVSNDTTGQVRGVHKTKEEASQQAVHLQKIHDKGIEMASAKMTPVKPGEGNGDVNI